MKIYNGTPSKYITYLQSLLDASIQWTENVAEKAHCDALLYVATPDLEGVDHIIDAVNDSNHLREKTLFFSTMDTQPVAFQKEFNPHQLKSLVATGKMIRTNGGHWIESEAELKDFLTKLHTSNG